MENTSNNKYGLYIGFHTQGCAIAIKTDRDPDYRSSIMTADRIAIIPKILIEDRDRDHLFPAITSTIISSKIVIFREKNI
jgi:hypothetical protein